MSSQNTKSPQHIAIIMDGNRRWAKMHKLEMLKGHEYVVNRCVEPLVDHCIKLGIPYLTLWAFSTENWQRDKQEVEGMMQLFRRAFERKAEDLHRKGVRLNVVGDLAKFPEDIKKNAAQWIEISKPNTKITVSFALNYGGREELLQAINKLMIEKCQMFDSEKLSSGSDLEKYLYTNNIPDPDLIIRPGGQKRLSGFMPWQSVYSELYFTDVLMPDFTPAELDKALEDYASRQRRFGK